MNFNDLEKTWARQTTTGGGLIGASLARRLDSEARHERRRVLGAIVAVAFALTVGWIVTLGAHYTGIKPLNPMGIVTLLVASLTDVTFFVFALRSARRIQNEIKSMGDTLITSVTASLNVIEARIRDTVLAAYGLPALALLSAILFLIKYLTGDLRGLGAIIGSAGTFLLTGAIAAAMGRRYKTHLLPRREELRRLLGSLADPT